MPIPQFKRPDRLITSLLVIFIFIVTLIVINSYLTRWALVYWFEKQGAEVSVADLRLNLWQSTLEIDQFSAVNQTGQQLSIGSLKVDWGWQPLFDQLVVVNAVTVESVKLDIVGDKLNPQQIGPIDLVKLLAVDEDAPAAVEQAPSDWQIQLGAVNLADFTICYKDLSHQYVDVALPIKADQQLIDNCLKWQQVALNTQLQLNGPDKVLLSGDIAIKALRLSHQSTNDWLVLDDLSVKAIRLADQQLGWQSLIVDNMQLFAGEEGQQLAYLGAGLTAVTMDKTTIDLAALNADVKLLGLKKLGLKNLWLVQQGVADKSHNKVNVASLSLGSVVGSKDKADINQLVVTGIELDAINADAQAKSAASVQQLSLESAAVISDQTADVTGLIIDGVAVQHQDNSSSINAAVQVNKFVLSQLNAQLNDAATTVQLSQLFIDTVALQHTNGKDNLGADAKVAKLTLQDLKGSADGGDLNGLSIDGIEVKHTELDSHNQNLATVGQVSVKTVSGTQEQLEIQHLAVVQTCVKQRKGEVSVHPLADVKQLKTAGLSVNITDSQAVVEQLMIAGTQLWQQANDSQYYPAVQLAQLSVDAADVSKTRQQIAGITLDQLGLLPDLTAKAAARKPLLNLAKLTVDTVLVGEGKAEAIDIGEVLASGFDGLVSYHPQQGVNLSNWLLASTTSEPVEKEPAKDQQPAKAITIKRFALTDSNKVTVIDNTLTTPQTHQLSALKVDIHPLILGAALKPDSQPAQVDFSTLIEQAGTLALKGTLLPQSGDVSMDLVGKLGHLDTTHYSDYSARHIAHRIDQGQLDIDFDIKVVNNQMDSEFKLLLKKFELAKLQAHEKSPVNNELGVPIPLALNLLRDSDDNIALDIPIKGDLNKPDFALSSVISTVTFKALKTAVLYNYSPLSVLSIAGGLVNLATALRFKSVDFANSDSSLSADGKAQLDKVGQVLGKKTKVDLVLCANASLQDFIVEPVPAPVAAVPVLVAAENDKAAAVKPAITLAGLTDEQRQGLIELANTRQLAAKAYLVEQHGIVEHRLLLCNVKFNNKADAKPVVAISL